MKKRMLLSFITSVFCMTNMYTMNHYNSPKPNPTGFENEKNAPNIVERQKEVWLSRLRGKTYLRRLKKIPKKCNLENAAKCIVVQSNYIPGCSKKLRKIQYDIDMLVSTQEENNQQKTDNQKLAYKIAQVKTRKKRKGNPTGISPKVIKKLRFT